VITVVYPDVDIVTKVKIHIVHTSRCVVAQGAVFLLPVRPAETYILVYVCVKAIVYNES
jgi:hypothetical protein